MASALLLGLILVCTRLTSGDVTHFQCTNDSVYAGDRVECDCTTSTGAIDWTISYKVLGSCDQNLINVKSEHFNAATTDNTTTSYGYNFTHNANSNSSSLTFYLNASESIFVTCKNGEKRDGATLVISDAGFVQAIINLTLAFNASGVTLHWEDIGNDCASTEYNVTIRDNASTSVLIHNTSDTTIHINSSDLLKNVTYTYTVKRCQHCSISKPFTLAPVEVMSLTIATTNTSDPCKNNSCCVNVTLDIILESSDMHLKHPSQNYSISYNSNAENTSVAFKINETKWTGSLKHNETYCFTVTPMNYFITGVPINNDTMITEYQCQPPGNGNNGSNGGDGGWSTGCIVGIILGVIGFIVIVGIIFIYFLCRHIINRISVWFLFMYNY